MDAGNLHDCFVHALGQIYCVSNMRQHSGNVAVQGRFAEGLASCINGRLAPQQQQEQLDQLAAQVSISSAHHPLRAAQHTFQQVYPHVG